MLQVYVRCFSTPLRVHHQSHVRYPYRYSISWPAPFLCSTLPVSINFLCHARMVGRASGFLPYLRLKFRYAWMSDFVSINQETHWAFSCGVLIFMNSTFATKFKNILLNHKINCNFKPNYFHKFLLRKKELEAMKHFSSL